MQDRPCVQGRTARLVPPGELHTAKVSPRAAVTFTRSICERSSFSPNSSLNRYDKLMT